MAELLSMTGYGSAKGVVEGLEVTVELKSVNNRYLDCNVRMPRNFLFAEETVKQAVSASVGRGKVDVFVSSASSANSDMTVAINHELAKGYFDAVSSIAKELGIETGLTANQIARYPDVLVLEKREMDKEVAAKELYAVAEAAVAEFNKMRAREGQRLKEDMLSKLESIESLVSFVETRSPQIVEEYRHRLEAKLREVLEEKALDEHRMVTEAAIFADRTAVDEETVRLRSHISQFRQGKYIVGGCMP